LIVWVVLTLTAQLCVLAVAVWTKRRLTQVFDNVLTNTHIDGRIAAMVR
jgi:hypothetical protein